MKPSISPQEFEQLANVSIDPHSRNMCLLGLENMAWELSRRAQSPSVKRQIEAARNRISLLKLLTTD